MPGRGVPETWSFRDGTLAFGGATMRTFNFLAGGTTGGMVARPRSAESAVSGGTPVPSGDELVVVSNRQPYSHEYAPDGRIEVDRPVGGLSEALDQVLRRAGGTWIAWGDGEADRAVVDGNDTVAVPPDDPAYSLRRVWLTDEQVEGYYYGFSNQVLWPLCHSCLGTVTHDHAYWERYRDVNYRFAEAAIEAADERAVIWFQDYHLGLAPRLVRERAPDHRLAHFWHVPWPDPETFALCPHAGALLDGLLGNDLLGFHLPKYVEQFLGSVEACLDGATVDRGSRRVHYDGRTTRVEAFPLGVPVDEIHRQATHPAEDTWAGLARRHALSRRHVAVGVDRLDYTKGIAQRLQGLERLWEREPRWRGSLTYVQIASESRSRIPAYRDVQQAVKSEVERINRRFGSREWRPVVFTTEHVPEPELCRLYRGADVALVTPLRDGMNLVAQEYVAANLDSEAALVLSEGAGAHDLLGEAAFTVTPFDADEIATAIRDALTMPSGERRERTHYLRKRVRENDIDEWPHRILGTLGAELNAGQRRIRG